jgi:hypothetical protein
MIFTLTLEKIIRSIMIILMIILMLLIIILIIIIIMAGNINQARRGVDLGSP